MFGWLFNKKKNAAAPAALAVAPAPAVDWSARLAQAGSNDEALLNLARTAGVPLATKQAAVEALSGEAALKAAELAFRGHDRRVHQLAKRRLQAAVAQRQNREQADRLIATARSLLDEADVPVNRRVELDQSWQALDGERLEPTQCETFIALAAQLAEQARQAADGAQQRKRSQADAMQALAQLRTACSEAAEGVIERGALAGPMDGARRVLETLPITGNAAATAEGASQSDLHQALQTAATLDEHLAVLDRLLAAPTASERSAPDADPLRAWQALTPIADARLAAALQARHARWQQARDQARQDRQSQRREAARQQGAERQRAGKAELGAVLEDSLTQAESALDAGQLADAHRHLSRIDAVLDGGEGPEALRARIAATQARLAQLRGWQHWAGSRAREELVAQAEALAAATLSTVSGLKQRRDPPSESRVADQDPMATPAAMAAPDGVIPEDATRGDAGAEASSPGASDSELGKGSGSGHLDELAASTAAEDAAHSVGALDAEVARLSIRQRTDLIDTLRARWKDIDRAGGGGGRALWPRFDAALKAAYEPVAAHVAAQRAARESNLAARQQLLDTLEAVGVPEPTDPRALASALDRFNVEWRKLGPLEHTVPREARTALVRRLEAAVRRVESPLQAARLQARAEREALLVRARTLAGEAQARGRDFTHDVRALQGEWQQHAKALPLSRSDEQALWIEFKAAIDSGFAAREAVFNARDAEFEGYAAERRALIERLQVRPDETPAAQRRLLADVEAAWQRCGPAPRARAAALDADFHAARDALRRCLDDNAQRAWQASCDALDAKLALCVAREQPGAEGDAAEASARAAAWRSLPALPTPLEEALRRRIEQAPVPANDAKPAVNDLLLRIETAWELPTPPAFEALRRERKLLALKEALEGQRPTTASVLTPDDALLELLGVSGLDAIQSGRLGAVLTAWRQRGPQRGS